jgi:hypothetical protein
MISDAMYEDAAALSSNFKIRAGDVPPLRAMKSPTASSRCLTFVIPTVPRLEGAVSYLNATLMSLRSAAREAAERGLFGGCIKARVVNLRPGKHAAFREAKLMYEEFTFVEKKSRRWKPLADDYGKWRVTRVHHNPENIYIYGVCVIIMMIIMIDVPRVLLTFHFIISHPSYSCA